MIFIIILLLILILIIIFLKKNEGLQILSSEVYNNIQFMCNKDTLSYFNNLDISSSSKIKNKILNLYIFDQIYPIGSFYVQYPDTDTNSNMFPDSKSPNSLFPGTKWQKKWDTESIFFRTDGKLSNYERVKGLQEYGLKKIYGTMSWVQSNRWNPGSGNEGVFGAKPTIKDIYLDGNKSEDLGHRNLFDINAFLNEKYISKEEIRVKNRLMIVWKRIS